MKYQFYYLIKFLQRNRILDEYLKCYNDYHKKSLSNPQELISEWNNIQNETVIFQMIDSGFANEDISFIWTRTKESGQGYCYWDNFCIKFVKEFRTEVVSYLIPKKLKGQKPIDFIVDSIKEIGLWEDAKDKMALQLNREILNDEHAKLCILDHMLYNTTSVEHENPILKIIINGMKKIMWTSNNYQREFWAKIDDALRRKINDFILS